MTRINNKNMIKSVNKEDTINNNDLLKDNFLKIKTTKFYQNIVDVFNTTKYNVDKLQLKTTCDLQPLNKGGGAPLMFILFSRMYKLELIKSLFKFTPKLDDIETFIEWYRIHQIDIDMVKMTQLIKNSKDQELLDIYSVMFEIKGSRSYLHESIYMNSFVSIDIQYDYERSGLVYAHYTGDNIDIHLYKYKDDLVAYHEIANYIVELVRNTSIKYGGSNNNLKLTLFMCKNLKQIQDTTQNLLLSCDNINSGSCYPGKSISIWRREEFIKVLFHETIHFCEFDFSSVTKGYSQMHKMLNDKIKIDGVDSCNESYTETLAIFMHSYLLSQLTSIDVVNVLLMELKFTIFQVCKLIKYYGGKSLRDMFKITMEQNTSVRSYFIIKYIMLYNLDKVFEYIDVNGITLNNHLKDYSRFIQGLIESGNYLLQTNNVFNMIDFNNKQFIIKTARMSLIDILNENKII